MKAIAWAIVLGAFMIGGAIEWGSGREKDEKNKAIGAVTFLIIVIGFIISLGVS